MATCGIERDRPVFHPPGGGQASDTGLRARADGSPPAGAWCWASSTSRAQSTNNKPRRRSA